MKSWIEDMIPEGSDFTLDNLPWGVFRSESSRDSICVAIGDYVMDVKAWSISLRESTEYDWSLEVEDALQQVPCESAPATGTVVMMISVSAVHIQACTPSHEVSPGEVLHVGCTRMGGDSC